MTKLNIISQNPESTLVAEFVPDQKRERNYQSEAMLEDAFIKQLQEQGYEYLSINDEKAGGIVVLRNFEDYYEGYDDENGKHHLGYSELVDELLREFPIGQPIVLEEKQKLFAKLFGILLGLLVRYINGCTMFWSGCLTAYALWCVVNWFDAFVLDCIWFCHDKHFVIPGTEDMTAAYHDYWFHIKGALIGMLLGIPAALAAGAIVII